MRTIIDGTLGYTNTLSRSLTSPNLHRRLARHLTKEKQKEQEQSEQENFKGKVREQTIVKLSSAERTKFLSLMTSVGGLRMKPDCSSAFFICVPQTGPFIEHLRNVGLCSNLNVTLSRVSAPFLLLLSLSKTPLSLPCSVSPITSLTLSLHIPSLPGDVASLT